MKVSEAFPSKYLKAADLGGKTWMLTISNVTVEDVGTEEKSERKMVMYFNEAAKGVVMNRTNASELELVYGDETDHWIGKKVELFSVLVPFQGKNVEGIRMRATRPSAAPGGTLGGVNPLSGAAPAAMAPAAMVAGVAHTMTAPARAYNERNPPPSDYDDSVPF